MFIGCKDDDVASGSFDPSQPVEFKDFSPKEGQVRTRLYIYGKNFGTDETKIHVNVGGKEAKVIGSTGEIIYCMVGKRSYDGTVTVTIDDKDGKPAATKTFDEKRKEKSPRQHPLSALRKNSVRQMRKFLRRQTAYTQRKTRQNVYM